MTAENSLSRRPLPLLLALSAAVAIALFSAACSRGEAQPSGGPPAAEVTVATLAPQRVHAWDDFTGRISAPETVSLRPRVSGYIERVAFHEGQDVRKGDLLFVIDPRPYQAELARAQGALEQARSQAALARAQNARAQSLIEAKVISREEFEARAAANDEGAAAVRSAEAAVAAARLNLEFTQVRSPIDGRAGRALVTAGNLAQADATELTTVVSLDPMYVYFDADEQTFLRYGAGDKNGAQATLASPVRVGLANESGYPHAGTVDFVDNQVDPQTGTIRARAVLANAEHALTPGLFARVQLQDGDALDALLVDAKAVLTDQDRQYVYVVGPGSTALRKDVILGRAVGDRRVVLSGLAAGDQVVVDGVQKIFFPGMPIKPSAPMATPAGAAAPATAPAAPN